MSTIKLSKSGLTKQGVAILQSLFIIFFAFIEISIRGGAGIVTGLAVCLAAYGGHRFGRPGSAYAAAVTPPLAFGAYILIHTIAVAGIRPSRFGVEFISGLASIAPFLLVSALYSWFIFFNQKAKESKPRARAE